MAEDKDEIADESVYGDESREEMMEGDSLSAEEEGFMRGYEESDEKDEVDVNEDEEQGVEEDF